MLYVLIGICLVSFFIYYGVSVKAAHAFDSSNTIAYPLAILNILLWIILMAATLTFVRMLNMRFGEKEFSGPKCQLFIFLCVFSLSFLVRGSWDIYTVYRDEEFENPRIDAATLFLVYFCTEVLPIFVIYLMHIRAFLAIIKRQKQ